MTVLLPHVGFFILGVIALVKGADFFTEGSSKLARHFGLSEFTIGLTLVAFATSLPELAVSMTASYFGSESIAVGNVIGSNIANVGLVIGLTALFVPVLSAKSDMKQGYMMLILLLLASLFLRGGLQAWEGFVLFGFLAGFTYNLLKGRRVTVEHVHEGDPRWHTEALFIIIGLAGVVAGGRLVVDASIVFARTFGISEAVIGMTIIAIGTSLPELATSVVAAYHKLNELALGNIIGSNMFNISIVLGLSSFVRTLEISTRVLFIDVPIMLGFSALLLLFMHKKTGIRVREGIFLLAMYAIFLWIQFRPPAFLPL